MTRPTGKRRPPTSFLDPILGPLDGAQIPGGCEHCDAFQVPCKYSSRVFIIQVHHDDWCPWRQQHRTAS